jgi:hypothetical protein
MDVHPSTVPDIAEAHHDHLKQRMIFPRCQLFPKYMYTVSQVALMGKMHCSFSHNIVANF